MNRLGSPMRRRTRPPRSKPQDRSLVLCLKLRQVRAGFSRNKERIARVQDHAYRRGGKHAAFQRRTEGWNGGEGTTGFRAEDG
jgi:hypothetical protein